MNAKVNVKLVKRKSARELCFSMFVIGIVVVVVCLDLSFTLVGSDNSVAHTQKIQKIARENRTHTETHKQRKQCPTNTKDNGHPTKIHR